jgi:hydrogenase/urease accessory protein HupE
MPQRVRRTWFWAIAVGLAISVFPRAAQAHLVTTGLGPVYDGIGHLVLTIDDLIPVLALALLAGLRGPKSGRWALFVLPVAWMIGGLSGLHAIQENTLPFQCVSFLVLGLLVSSDLPIPAIGVAALAIALGLFHGYADGSAIKDAGVSSGVLEFIGIMVALFVIVALISALVVWLRWYAARIVVRVAGSWIAAMGLLLLGWAIHKGTA